MVERERQHLRVVLKVPIRGENRRFQPLGDGTEQKVRIRTLDAACPTKVEVLSCPFVVLEQKLDIGKST
jgi:hypothetical protein